MNRSIAALKSNAVCVAACSLQVSLGGDLQRLVPAGTFSAPRGALSGDGPWLMTEAAARKVIALAAARTTDIVIDYEHQTLLTEKNGEPAPASGWIDHSSLEWRDDGLYGRVDWKARAAKLIEEDEYRYLSPVFPYDAKTGEVLDLYHVALTNAPAIDEAITALAAARMASHETDHTEEDDSVDKAKLIALLGLAADATDADIEAGLAALKADSTELAALREGLEVEQDGNAVAAVAALKGKAAQATTPDLSQYVPKAVYQEAQTQLAALKTGGDTAEMDRLVKEGLDDGRIAGKATAEYLRGQGLAALKAHLEDAPCIAALKGTQTQGKKPEGDDTKAPSPERLAVCSQFGLDPAEIDKAS